MQFSVPTNVTNLWSRPHKLSCRHVGGQLTGSNRSNLFSKQNKMEKQDVVESDYLKSLDSKTAPRYKEKIGIINNLDPYTLKRKELNENIEIYPAVMYPDMVNYFLLAPSLLTNDELKCYKSLQSYNNFLQCWVQWIGVRQLAKKEIPLIWQVSIFFSTLSLQNFLSFLTSIVGLSVVMLRQLIRGHDGVGLHTQL